MHRLLHGCQVLMSRIHRPGPQSFRERLKQRVTIKFAKKSHYRKEGERVKQLKQIIAGFQ